MKVYLLQHSYEYEIYEDIKTDNTLIIGIYESLEKAQEVQEQLILKKGFNRFSEECFIIDEYERNKSNWTEGFVTWDGEKEEWVEE